MQPICRAAALLVHPQIETRLRGQDSVIFCHRATQAPEKHPKLGLLKSFDQRLPSFQTAVSPQPMSRS